jgi:hypothetical protein
MSSRIGIVCPYRFLRSLCAAMSLFFLLGMNSSAQVTIKERVELGAGAFGLRPMAPSDAQNYFIAPRNGVLRIDSGIVERIYLPLPANSYLEATVRDTSYRTNIYTLFPCFDEHDAERDTCGVLLYPDIYWNRWPWNRWPISEPCTEPTPNAFYVGPVEGGDTVRFSFTGARYNPMFYIEEDPDSVWRVYMQTPAAPGCEGPNRAEYGFVFVSYVQPKGLRIVDHTPHEIWPYLRPQNNGDSRGADQPGYDPKRAFVISLLDTSGQPLPGVSVKIKSEFVAFSGGHDHNDPLFPTNQRGLFFKSGSGSNPKSLTTDANGVAIVDSFRASEIGGEFLITAYVSSDSTIKDTVNLRVRVPNLLNFASIQTNFWNLTGNTGTTTACGNPPIQIRHSSNHYANQTLYDNLQLALSDFFIWSGSPQGFNHYLKLFLNDMSLECGGVFDICSNWDVDRKHSFHRVAASVDINQTAIEFQGTATFNLKNELVEGRTLVDWLTHIMGQRGGIRFDREEEIHYGFGGAH